jgi:hypothetical protein
MVMVMVNNKNGNGKMVIIIIMDYDYEIRNMINVYGICTYGILVMKMKTNGRAYSCR